MQFDIANEHLIPLMLIASRRQVDSQEMGGGYVNNWTTEDFAREKKMIKRLHFIKGSRRTMAEQPEIEEKLNLEAAMVSKKFIFN